MNRVFLFSLVVLTAYLGATPAWSCNEDFIRTPRPFMGKHGEIFQLGDGSIWQVKHAYEYLYEYNPSVIICPGINKLIIGDAQIDVVPLSQGTGQQDRMVIESKIDGTFKGWRGDTIIKLTNGQIWQQAEYYYSYRFGYRRLDVLIYQTDGVYKMKVEGDDRSVRVIRLR